MVAADGLFESVIRARVASLSRSLEEARAAGNRPRLLALCDELADLARTARQHEVDTGELPHLELPVESPAARRRAATGETDAARSALWRTDVSGPYAV